MFLNDEIKKLNKGLIAAEKILEPNGLLVVSFHSIEDRIVKNFFSLCSGKSKSFSKFFPEDKRNKSFEILTKKPLVPTQEEIYNNPKSRSAKLRIAIRTSSDPLHEVAAMIRYPSVFWFFIILISGIFIYEIKNLIILKEKRILSLEQQINITKDKSSYLMQNLLIYHVQRG